jgi:hypothetical protein
MNGPHTWKLYRFDDAGISVTLPSVPRHEAIAEEGPPGRDMMRHVISLAFGDTQFKAEVELIRCQDPREMASEGIERDFAGTLLPGFYDEAVRTFRERHHVVSVRTVDMGGREGREVICVDGDRLVTAWVCWTPETIFSGGARWTTLTASGDTESVERFLQSVQVLPSAWLLERFRRWRDTGREI